jgi:lactate racemase
MGMKEYTFGFGTGTQSVMLPEEHVSDLLEGKAVPAVDVKAATIDCMRHPIGSKPLAEIVHPGEKVCLVCADVTRSWNRAAEFVIYIVNELNAAGIPDEDMVIVFAQGTHRAHTPEENVRTVGEEVCRRIRLVQHDSRNKDGLVYMGDTKLGTPVWLNRHVVEADRVILVNGITTHLFAGYGGGRKLILPGVAGWETVQKNHCHALADTFGGGVNPKTRSTQLSGNIVSDDMQEAADMVKPCFLIHSVLNAEGQICQMVGGDPYEAWLAGTKKVYEVQRVPFKQKADVSFACAGGYPKDVSLYQGCKCYDPAEAATKEGGIVIAIMEARDIMEPPEYMGSFRFEKEEDMERALRDCFTIPFFVAFNLFSMAHRYTIYLVTKPENFEEVKKTHQIPVATVEEAWKLAKEQLAREGKEDYTINIMPHCASIVPVLE